MANHRLDFSAEMPKKKKGEEFDSSPSFTLAPWRKLYPIGVLVALAPEPEVSTRITPD
jgi:hypothetical protein